MNNYEKIVIKYGMTESSIVGDKECRLDNVNPDIVFDRNISMLHNIDLILKGYLNNLLHLNVIKDFSVIINNRDSTELPYMTNISGEETIFRLVEGIIIIIVWNNKIHNIQSNEFIYMNDIFDFKLFIKCLMIIVYYRKYRNNCNRNNGILYIYGIYETNVMITILDSLQSTIDWWLYKALPQIHLPIIEIISDDKLIKDGIMTNLIGYKNV